MLRGKDWLGLMVGMLVMIAAAIINSIVVQPMFEGSKSIRYDFYCAISQLMPFVFVPSLGNYFTKDYEDYSDSFYSNMGIPFKKYYMIRLFVVILTGTSIISLGTGGYFLRENVEVMSGLNILIILLLQYIYVVLIVGIIAYCTKKRITTIISTIFGTMLMSVINILPIPILQGNLFLLDNHSIITTNINEFVVLGDVNKYRNNVVILMIWIFVLFLIYYTIIVSQKEREER